MPLWPKDVSLDNVWRDERIWEVNRPGMYCHTVPDAKHAVIICTGGAYRKLNPSNCGLPHALWFNSLGIDAYVLVYSLPTRSGLACFNDMGRARQLLKDKYERIGAMGFSAGGHLAALSESNFLITCSPVITLYDPWR